MNRPIVGIAIVVLILITIGSFINARFTANEHESNTTASYEKEQAALTEWEVVLDLQTQVKLQTDSIDLAKLEIMFNSAAAQHGMSNSGGVLALMNVQGMPASHDLANRLMTTIDGKYAKYQETQTTRIDRDRTYQNYLKSSIGGFFASMQGFPTQAYKDKGMSTTVKTSKTQKTYDTKTIEPGKLFK